MNIEVKYNIGDNVQYRMRQELNQYEICGFCNGNKQIQGADHTVLPCPKCNGYGQVKKINYQDYSGIINNIIINYDANHMTTPEIIYFIESIPIKQENIIGLVESSSENEN